MAVTAAPAARTLTKLNSNQIKGFWAAWGGWTLDGMDAFIYALVLVPALTELLPKSGVAVTPGNVGYYGSILQALFLLGWGLSMVWGPIADRFGRIRALILTILFYSVFTFLCGLVTNIWQRAVLRLLDWLGLGGKQPMAGTCVDSLLFTVSIVGLWSGSIYVPAAVTQIAVREGYAAAAAARLASYGSMVLAIATIIGCLMAPFLAERLGRRGAMGLYFVALGVAVAIAFGYVFYMPAALTAFFVLIFFLGIGGANFAMYTLWLPEQYSTGCRASAIAFVSSVGRFVGVAMVFLVGTTIQRYGSLGVPVAATASVFVLGLVLLPSAGET